MNKIAQDVDIKAQVRAEGKKVRELWKKYACNGTHFNTINRYKDGKRTAWKSAYSPELEKIWKKIIKEMGPESGYIFYKSKDVFPYNTVGMVKYEGGVAPSKPASTPKVSKAPANIEITLSLSPKAYKVLNDALYNQVSIEKALEREFKTPEVFVEMLGWGNE